MHACIVGLIKDEIRWGCGAKVQKIRYVVSLLEENGIINGMEMSCYSYD